MTNFVQLSAVASVLWGSALLAGEPPVTGDYPGRCAERYGRSVAGEATTVFTCGGWGEGYLPDGFKLDNLGGNPIIPIMADPYSLAPSRAYWFNFPGRHRQEMSLLVVDLPSEIASDMRLSKFYFFPRQSVPEFSMSGINEVVTLPTGESVTFDRETHTVTSGAFREGPMDLTGYARDQKLFADIHYVGSGVVVRLDRRGPASFHVGVATISQVSNGTILENCIRPSSEIFLDTSTELKFAEDAQFSAYIGEKCGFTLPVAVPSSVPQTQ